MKWKHPEFVRFERKYVGFEVPPENNANYAFVLTGINIADKNCFLLPASALEVRDVEKKIVKALINLNLLSAVIALPDKMFESTSIATYILIFDKNKYTQKVVFVNAKNAGKVEIREQKGMFGGASHEQRTYKKTLNTLEDDVIDNIADIVRTLKEVKGFSAVVDIKTIKDNDYSIKPNSYINVELKGYIKRL